MPGDVVASCSE
jgi:hypothetical protein